jgi:spore maturation protein CgeB
MSYDEEFHKPFASASEVPAAFRSEVAFVGTWMRYEKRDEFLHELVQQGVPISIWGDRWEKSPLFSKLKPYWRGRALTGRDYVASLQGAKICLGLLSKGNRDMHTMRSLETPFAGGLICAERTPEHEKLYSEGEEAVFWSDATECAAVCKRLLADDTERERIRAAGTRRVLTLNVGNEDVGRRVVEAILPGQGQPNAIRKT